MKNCKDSVTHKKFMLATEQKLYEQPSTIENGIPSEQMQNKCKINNARDPSVPYRDHLPCRKSHAES